MTNIEMIDKIKELKELEQYKKEIDSEIESLKDEIKKALDNNTMALEKLCNKLDN